MKIYDEHGKEIGHLSLSKTSKTRTWPRPRTIIVGAGHGGWDIDKEEYQTRGKAFEHKGFDRHPQKNWFLEGFENRLIAERLCTKLLALGIPFRRSYLPTTDLDLKERGRIVSDTYEQSGCTLSIDIHTNAISKKSSKEKLEKTNFWSVWTSPGQTQSDKFAEYLYFLWKDLDPFIKPPLESQKWSDGDHDYEAAFTMLQGVKGPAVLTEAGFMTSRESVEFLTSEQVRNFRVDCLTELCVWAQNQ